MKEPRSKGSEFNLSMVTVMEEDRYSDLRNDCTQVPEPNTYLIT